MAIFDMTPAVKKKVLVAQAESCIGELQDRYIVQTITLSKTGWTSEATEAMYSNVKQTASIALEANDFVMVDADGADDALMSEYNVYATIGTTSADNDGDGSQQMTTLVFHADSTPSADIKVELIVFSYADGDYSRTESPLGDRIAALETRVQTTE